MNRRRRVLLDSDNTFIMSAWIAFSLGCYVALLHDRLTNCGLHSNDID